MSPTVEQPETRIYCLQMKDGAVVRVRAATICRPSLDDPWYGLKREGQLVGEFNSTAVSGWWIDEPSRCRTDGPRLTGRPLGHFRIIPYALPPDLSIAAETRRKLREIIAIARAPISCVPSGQHYARDGHRWRGTRKGDTPWPKTS